ncbi:gamma-glutamyl-gamma-aminobutyrate hydrolase family protein [Streptomyces sp. NPDC051907]|uniref:gamma-glutamyl-gamma-aminobutyrate hydrolase family protein n=1 Tax=Streptomyces sp. NPDC051907 TaxID=3155284 RepID=UPI00341DF9DD
MGATLSKPLIGVTTYLEPAQWGVWHQPAAVLHAQYHRMVQSAGGLATLLPPDDPAAAEAVVARLDGVVIAGGADVEPVRYGASPDPRTGPPARERDAWELALIHAALASGTPLLGICRGLQLLNVALGGTLVQHLDGHSGGRGVVGQHTVKPVPGTLYADIAPEATSVPTYHHQSVDRLADTLTASAYAEDGTIEAVELSGHPDGLPPGWVLAVQWHPELGDDPRVISALVTASQPSPAGD